MHKLRSATLGSLFCLTMSAGFAASPTNFSGHWVLDPAASKLKFNPGMTQSLDIDQKDSTLDVMETTGGMKQKHSYTLDGVKHKTNVEGVVTVEVCAKWDGTSLQMSSDAGRSKVLETWKLTDGGKTLSIDHSMTGIVSRQEQLTYRKR